MNLVLRRALAAFLLVALPVAQTSVAEDAKPKLKGPIGLQLHSNKVPQEVRFRGLILSEDPEDRLITVSK